MRCSLLVAATVGVTISLAGIGREIRMTILLAVFDVGTAVVVVVFPSALDAVVETAALDLVELSGRNFPAFLRERGRFRRCGRGGGRPRAWIKGHEAERNSGYYQTAGGHRLRTPFPGRTPRIVAMSRPGRCGNCELLAKRMHRARVKGSEVECRIAQRLRLPFAIDSFWFEELAWQTTAAVCW